MSRAFVKLLSFALVLLLLFAVVTGCTTSKDTSNDQPNDEGSSEVEENQDDEEEPEVSEEPVEEEPAEPEVTYDFGGRSINYVAWWNTEPTEGSSLRADRVLGRTRELEEKYNFKMEYTNVPMESYLETLTSSTLAGDPFGEIVYVQTLWFYPTLAANGFLYPVSDLGVFDFSEEKWNQDFVSYGTVDGKVYGFETGRTFVNTGLFWNKTIFEREGLPNLYELQNNYEWTWDKMLEIAQKATKDLDGDGIIDQWGMGGIDSAWSFVYSNNAEILKIENGKPIFTLNQPNAIEGLQTYQDFIHKYKVFELPPSGSPWDYAAQQFQDGKYAMLNYQWWITDRLQPNMQDDYGFVMFPMGPRADEYVSEMKDGNLIVVPATVSNPKEVAIVWDDLTDPFPDEDPDEWREDYENRSRDMETVATCQMVHEKNLTKINYLRNFRGIEELSWDFIWQITTGNKTPQVAIDEIAERAQKVLDDALAK